MPDPAPESAELSEKLRRIAAFLGRHNLDALLLTERANFAWITCGRCNRIANNSTRGVASILVDGNTLICLANDIEAPRMRREEFAQADIETISFPWWDPAAAKKAAAEAIAGRRVGTDGEDFGLSLKPLPPDFVELRWSLTPREIARFRDSGRRAAAAMERACRTIRHGDSEHDVAGVLDHEIHSAGLTPVVTLVAADERLTSFRHPIATAHRVERMAMLVTCAEFAGLITCLTRLVSFGPLSADIAARHRAVCAVEAAVLTATRPGRTLGDIFTDLISAYAQAGYPDQWRLHHQGGSAGYANREALALPSSRITVRENQPFAWNPSITGVKTEDTTLATAAGIEVLTPMSNDWPKITIGQTAHPDILVR